MKLKCLGRSKEDMSFQEMAVGKKSTFVCATMCMGKVGAIWKGLAMAQSMIVQALWKLCQMSLNLTQLGFMFVILTRHLD